MTTGTKPIKENPHTDNMGVTGEAVLNLPTPTIAVGIDWVTATTDRQDVGYGWFDLFKRHCRERGVKDTPWQNRWYSGHQTDSLFWGYNKHYGYVFIASSDNARLYAPMATYSARHVTRMDLQVTVRLDKPSYSYAKQTYKNCCNSHASDRRYSLITNSNGGDTLYVGSRQSDQFGRLYDKGVESGLDKKGYMWRYEVELKKPRAGSAAIAVMQERECGNLDEAILNYVHQWFVMRGVKPKFRATDTAFVVEVSRKITTDERKLEWLRTQVRPTVADLIERGFEQETFAALGIY